MIYAAGTLGGVKGVDQLEADLGLLMELWVLFSHFVSLLALNTLSYGLPYWNAAEGFTMRILM